MADFIDLDANGSRPGSHSRDVRAAGVCQTAFRVFVLWLRLAVSQEKKAAEGFRVWIYEMQPLSGRRRQISVRF